jgi:MtfA peptidase
MAMRFPFLAPDRRPELWAEPFPDEWLPYLRENVFLYRFLSEAEQATLRDAVKVFVGEKRWEGCAGLTITDEIKVTIAGQACLLLLGFEDYYFDEVQSVLVYPGGYLAVDPYGRIERGEYQAGQAPAGSNVILSWWYARWYGRRRDHSNVVLHEFAHKLAELHDRTGGLPPTEDLERAAQWEEILAAAYERLCEAAFYERPTILWSYGATNRAEFFAVATEAFFLEPVLLRRWHPELYQVLAEAYHQDPAARRQPDEADLARAEADNPEYFRHLIAETSAALRRQPDDLDAYRTRASCYMRLKEPESAAADYTTLLALASDDARVEAYCERGVAYAAMGRFNQALADFDLALRFCPGYARAYYERGVAECSRGNLDQAVADLTQAIRADRQDHAPYHERGLAFFDKGEYDKAVRDLSEAIRLAPHGAKAYRDRAVVYLRQGDYDRAIADCTTALERKPSFAEARTLLEEAQAGKARC